jgi:hypothetical protein
VTATVEKLTGMPHTHRTEADIKKWFARADFDKRWGAVCIQESCV